MTFDEWQRRIRQNPWFDRTEVQVVPEGPMKTKDFGADNKWKEESFGEDQN